MNTPGQTPTLDLDAAARAAYEGYLPFRSWNDLDQEERDDWRRVAVAVLETHDPMIFGVAIEEIRRMWKIIGPVVGPFARLLVREDSCTKPE